MKLRINVWEWKKSKKKTVIINLEPYQTHLVPGLQLSLESMPFICHVLFVALHIIIISIVIMKQHMLHKFNITLYSILN